MSNLTRCSSAVIRRAQGSQVRDTGIFRAHAARYEAEFLEDMTKLGETPHTAAMH